MAGPEGPSVPGAYAARRRAALSLAASAALLAAHALSFDDAARFAGDTWEYQSIAVNLLKGAGFPRFGQAVPFREYAFEPGAEAAPHYPRFVQAASERGDVHFYRTPGYPAFLGAVYALAGVHPLAAKLAQSLLLLAVSGSLIWIGRRLWDEEGEVAGAVAGPVYAGIYGYQAGAILTEPLIAFSLALAVAAYLSWAGRPSPRRAGLLGASFALSLYVKASNAFIPAFIAVLMLSPRADMEFRRRAAHALAALGSAVLLMCPYAAFATARNGRPVLLSTQGPTSLLDNNNEFSVAKGAWAPEWREDPGAFYNRPEVAVLPPLAKVAAFYARRPRDLPAAVRYKLEAGFRDAIPLKAVLAVLWADAAVFMALAALRRRGVATALPVEGSLAVLSAALLGMALTGVLGFVPLAASAGVLVLVRGGGGLYGLLPGIHLALLANFALIFAVFDGAPRFFSVVQPFFILLAARVALATALAPARWADSVRGAVKGPATKSAEG